jgi:hypothetical protein
LATIVTFAALTGMRRGDFFGLRWSDIEWDNSAVVVRRWIGHASGKIGKRLKGSTISIASFDSGSDLVAATLRSRSEREL